MLTFRRRHGRRLRTTASAAAAAARGPRLPRLFVTLRGPEPRERYDEPVAAVNRHCPVLDVVVNPVPVEREVRIA